MTISKSVIDKLNRTYRFNMVNLENEKFKNLGLKPLYLTVQPQYINLQNNIFYNTEIAHYECLLCNDVATVLHVMNSNLYDRYEDIYNCLNDNFTIHFQIYNNQIFFNEERALNIYKNYPEIRNEINKKFNLKDDFYEPTIEEIYQNYGRDYFYKNNLKFGTDFKYCRFNLTPQEHFKILISSKRRTLVPYESTDELDADTLRQWLNCNANVFTSHICSRETTGVYNKETLALINSLLDTKLDIYNFFAAFSKQSKNWQDVIKKLLTKLRVYKEFVKKEIIIHENLFDDEGMSDEINHWRDMFYKASNDILVQFVGFDKIETQQSKTITTSKPNIYEEFFNLLIMDYNIVQLPKLIFDEKIQGFRWICPNEFINSGINRECEKEIKLIRKYVPYDKRHLYFRD